VSWSKKIDFEISTDLYVLRSQESEKVDNKNVRLSVLCGDHSEDTIATINTEIRFVNSECEYL